MVFYPSSLPLVIHSWRKAGKCSDASLAILPSKQRRAKVTKIVVLDKIGEHCEPYDRKYILGEVAGYCYRNPSILRNAGMTTVMHRGYLAHKGVWENHDKPVSCVCFEIDELTEAKWQFLLDGIGGWSVDLELLPDDWEMTVIYPSKFKR